MKYKFYSPYLIWFGIWLFICVVVLSISLHINQLYLHSSMAREWVWSRGSPGVFARQFGVFQGPLDLYQFPAIPWEAYPQPGGFSTYSLLKPDSENQWRDYFLPPGPPSFFETLGNQRNWLQAWQSAAHAGFFFTILSYLLFVVGFGAICLITAIYQNHFRRAQEEQFAAEIEARNLRIQVLESSRNALDLRLKLLDQDHEKALTAAREAQENIRNLEEKFQSEADRNEELQADLQNALQEENKALKMLRSLDRDRQKIATEKMDIASRLAEAEKAPEADLQKIRKARGRLRLNYIWLTSLYQNLSFSPRALQNIGELQEVSEVFPSLPDALAKINRLSLGGLLSGEKLPPKSVVRFATQELEHFQGPFWEYRFSSDGRIFFGLSKSRTWNIDTILLKRRFPDKKEKYDRYLAGTLGKDNQDLQRELTS